MRIILSFFVLISSVNLNAQWSQMGGDINGVDSIDYCGASVVLNKNGNRLAVGTPKASWILDDEPYIQIFEFDGSDWVQMGDNILEEYPGDDLGRRESFDLDTSGSIIAVGAYGNDEVGDNAGHVRVFQFDGSDWIQLGEDIDGANADDHFGQTVSLSDDGTILAVGISGYDNGDDYFSGGVQVYKFDGDSWIPLGSIIPGEAADDFFSRAGMDINSDGTILAVGSSHNDDGGDSAGHVRVFQFDGFEWNQIGGDLDGTDSGNYMGYGVSISASGLIISTGSFGSDEGGAGRGKVRFYEYDGIDWIQMGSDLLGASAADAFGFSTDLSGDGYTCAIGGYGNDDGALNAGHVQVYNYYEGDWHLLFSPINGEITGESSGNMVSISTDGMRVALGAPFNGEVQYRSGQARVYERPVCEPSESTISETVCGAYTVPSGDETYFESGEYTDTISTILGCDSIIVINLIIATNYSEQTVFECDSYIVPSGDETYFESGIYLDTITNVLGCDSIITINLSIGNSDTLIAVTSCYNYTVPSDDETYFESGEYTDTLNTVDGCDSLIFIDLIIIEVDTDISYLGGEFTATSDADAYQWLDCKDMLPLADETNQTFTPSLSGEYAVIVTEEECIDTSECVEFSDLSIEDVKIQSFITISPNPIKNSATIHFDKDLIEPHTIVIYSMTGKIVYSNTNISGTSFSIKCDHLKSGTYVLELINPETNDAYTANLIVM